MGYSHIEKWNWTHILYHSQKITQNGLYIAGENEKRYSCFRKWNGGLSKFNIELSYDSAILLLSLYILKKTENLCPPKNWYTNVPNSIFQIDKTWKKTQIPINW